MKKILLSVCTLLLGTQAFAIELGLIGGAETNGVTTDNSIISYSSGSSYQIGGLFLFSIFPFVQVRTGLIYKTRKINSSAPGIDATLTDNLLNIPINLEVGLPLNFYVFGGVIYSATQSSSCSGNTCSSKTPDDVPINLGVGFNILDIPLFKLGVEGEYEQGTHKIETSGSSTSKVHDLGLNLVAKFGF